MWHAHKWQKFDVEYNPPPSREVSTSGLGWEAAQMAMYGFTNITWKCMKCPAVKIEREIGKVSL
jgi:hypothetical protein